jgi:hypothetical protein
MTVFVKVKRAVVMKLEAASGTAETLANADHNFRAFDIAMNPEIEKWLNEFASGRHSKAQAVMGKKKMVVSFKHAMNLGSAKGTAPAIGKAFKACGALETVVASTSVTYTPNATKDEGNSITATISVFLIPVSGNAIEFRMKGAMGNFVVSMDDLGRPLVAAFTFTGAYVGQFDSTALVLTSPDTSIPPAVLGVAITAAGTAQKIGKLSLDAGNDVQLDYDPADATGYHAAYIAKRDPKLNMDPKAQLLATDPVYTRWNAGTEHALSVATAAGAASQVWTLSCPVAQIVALKPADRNSAETYDLEYELHESAGNDEWSLAAA